MGIATSQFTIPLTDDLIADMEFFSFLNERVARAAEWMALKAVGIEPDFDPPEMGAPPDNYCYECGRSCDCG